MGDPLVANIPPGNLQKTKVQRLAGDALWTFEGVCGSTLCALLGQGRNWNMLESR